MLPIPKSIPASSPDDFLRPDEIFLLAEKISALRSKHTRSIEWIDGFLVFCAISPANFSEELLFAALFSQYLDPAAIPDDPNMLSLIRKRIRELRHLIAIEADELHPLILYPTSEDENGDTILENADRQIDDWCCGFVAAALFLHPNRETNLAIITNCSRIFGHILHDCASENIFNPVTRFIHEEKMGEFPQDEDAADAMNKVMEDVFQLKDYFASKVAAHPTHYRAGRVGRNDPCPCGSGKKYKQCCGRRY